MIKTINVTQECINTGRHGSCKFCPVALAFKRIIFCELSVTPVEVAIWFEYGIVNSINIPKSAKDFIYKFDSGKKVKPFKFKLDIPERFLK